MANGLLGLRVGSGCGNGCLYLVGIVCCQIDASATG